MVIGFGFALGNNFMSTIQMGMNNNFTCRAMSLRLPIYDPQIGHIKLLFLLKRHLILNGLNLPHLI